MRYRAVSLDLFDTLVDLFMERLPRVQIDGREVPTTTGELHAALAEREAVPFEAFHEALRAVDREHRDVRYREHREIGTVERFTAVAERLGLADPELPERLTEVHMGRLRTLSGIPGHHAGVLERLRGLAPVGICSNFTHSETARRILAEGALAPHLDAVVISEDVGVRKPRAEIFDAVVEGLGAEPEQTLHVGDNLDADVSGAAARGLPTAWITRRVKDPDAVLAAHLAAERGPRPDWIVADLEELLEIVAG